MDSLHVHENKLFREQNMYSIGILQQRMCRSCLMASLGIENFRLPCRIIDIVFIMFAELWVPFSHTYVELWATFV